MYGPKQEGSWVSHLSDSSRWHLGMLCSLVCNTDCFASRLDGPPSFQGKMPCRASP